MKTFYVLTGIISLILSIICVWNDSLIWGIYFMGLAIIFRIDTLAEEIKDEIKKTKDKD